MKNLVAILVALVALQAQATQQIFCYQTNKDGSRKVSGGTLSAKLEFSSDESVEVDGDKSSVTVRGFWKKGARQERKGIYISADMSKLGAEVRFTHINFNDDEQELLEYQLQFDYEVLNRKFLATQAKLVMGLENNSTDYVPSWGYNMICTGRLVR